MCSLVTMTMLKYVKREVRPSYKQLILSQQDIEAAQKSVADAINTAVNKSQQFEFCADHFYTQGAYNEIDNCSKSQLVAYIKEGWFSAM